MGVPKYPGEKVDNVADFSIKQKDVLDLKLLYESMHDWLVRHGYGSTDDKKFGETLFLQRVGQDGAREIWFRWRVEKTPDDVGPGDSPRLIYQIRINAHTLGVKKTEIVKDGKKLKLDKGEVEVMIKANIIKDPKDAYKKSNAPEFLKKWFWKGQGQDELDKHGQILFRETYAFGDMLKRFFEMHTLTPEPQGEFYPQRGIFE